MRRIIQIAGISDQQEAEMLIACGVDWLGFPLRLTVHKEDLLETEAAQIIKLLRLPNEGVLITYPQSGGRNCRSLSQSRH